MTKIKETDKVKIELVFKEDKPANSKPATPPQTGDKK